MIDFSADYSLDELVMTNFVNLNERQKMNVHAMRNHSDVRSRMLHDTPIDPADHLRFCKKLETDRSSVYYVLSRLDKDLGVIYLTGMDFLNRNGFLGVYANPFAPEIDHKGTYCMKALAYLAFSIATLHTLKLEVLESNHRAIRLYEKSGFSEEGRWKEFVARDGKWLDLVLMGKTSETE
jgi:UDP-4-amino-4,6-dideoxy-N-acetyl-beta-L-altrosamine N-acetyltransferase